ncbi:LysR family transcriptional regulator [Acidisoma cellulosilytica]|uniref:LysR family transcriptional regulator n=1 Tax=Acidisoma cellulosilyticum TaxID=2802395 RepID=A0A963Z5X7_9PROT|nr:LysR family transcriptional regulator [Acidisoma cellulosilyticum]MCB8882428.1 LysR family transcriptional regulator [Acidisoma cellulosilyticum]
MTRQTTGDAALPAIRFRIYLDNGGHIGPGKVELLEHIERLGSIAAAGREMGMSYRRAWELVRETGQIFGRPVTTRHAGGRHGGGAKLTPLGQTVIARFRAAEAAITAASQDDIAALEAEIHKPTES